MPCRTSTPSPPPPRRAPVSRALRHDERLEPSGILQNISIYTNCIVNVKKAPQGARQKPRKVQKPDGATTTSNELCDPDVETCSDLPWIAEIVPPALTCETALDAGYESYPTMLDTATGRTYRDGYSVDAEAQPCALQPGANGLWDNVFIFTTARFENGDRSHSALSFPNNMQVGRIDGCAEGGGARVYAAGSLWTPSGTLVHGSHFILLGDASMSAKADGTYGPWRSPATSRSPRRAAWGLPA